MTTGFWRQALAVTRKEIVAEIRTGEVLLITAPFGAVVLLLVPLAIGTDRPLLSRVGPGMYWVVVLIFGIMVAIRQSATDGPPQRDLLGLLGIDPAARFAGQAIATTSLLLLFEAILLPVAGALYSPDISGWGWLAMAGLLPMFAVGLGLLGTLAGWLTVSLTTGRSLVPLLVAPLAIPLLLSATQALEGLRLRVSIGGWVLLLLALDLILAVAGVLSARPLEEASR
jgi:heme exporter protein B